MTFVIEIPARVWTRSKVHQIEPLHSSHAHASLESRALDCSATLKAADCKQVARVFSPPAAWDLAFVSAQGALLLIRCSEQPQDLDTLELETIASQGTFDRIVLIREDVCSGFTTPGFDVWSLERLQQSAHSLSTLHGQGHR